MDLFKRFQNYLHNSTISIFDRMFMLVSFITIAGTVFACLIMIALGGLTTGLIIIGLEIIMTGLIILGYKYRRLPIVAVTICFILAVVSMPIAMVFEYTNDIALALGYLFCTIYITLVLPGLSRRIILALMFTVAGAAYARRYYVAHLADPTVLPDSYILYFTEVVIFCVIASLLIGFQTRLFIEQTRTSQKQKEEIESLHASQNRFFSSMSHEIRTPVNTIIGLNEMILRENASDEINENAANIQAAGRMLLHLINDILDMSKFESGQMELVPVTYRTGDMLSDIVGMLWLRAKEKGLELHINVSPDLPQELVGDEVRIKQILINVLNNAIKYTEKGSVTLSIQCERTGAGAAKVIYSVADTGMGIKKESMPYLFTAFKRVDSEKNRYIEGTGLGLSIVKQFVDMMGGTISVNSVYTKGSTFIIEIPQQIANDTEIGDLEFDRRHTTYAGTTYHQSFEAPEAHVLVVDDTAANLLVVKKLLRDTKVQLTTVGSGREALDKTLETHFDVIFMDHLMPKMDGIECFHAIRNQTGGLCRESRIVALTANAGSESAALYAEEGFDGYVVKPVTGEALEAELRRQLPRDLITLTGSEEEILEESLSWNSDHKKVAQVAITTETVADLPQTVLDHYHIGLFRHRVETAEGIFRDGLEIEQVGLLAYMNNEKAVVKPQPPSVADHEAFFAGQLEHANNIVHISISSTLESSGCIPATEAAQAFDNVFVVDTGHLSSGQGLLAVDASRWAQEGKSAAEIVEKLNYQKKLVHTSFVVDSLDYLARCGQVSGKIASITKAFMIRPVLSMRGGKLGVGKIYLGSRKHVWRKYIHSVLNTLTPIDKRMLFVTYVGLTQKDLDWIRDEIGKKMDFDRIYFQKASPAIAVNCGPGTFGLLFQTET